MRVFLAIEIPNRIKKALERIQGDLESRIPGVRWEKPEKLHITLVFFGRMENERAAGLETAVREGVKRMKGVKDLNIGFLGVGFFPKKRPRVVLMEIGEGREEIEELQKRLAAALSEAGFEFARLSKPHVTLGRFRRQHSPTLRVRKLQPQAEKTLPTLRVGKGLSFRVKEVVIVESKLHPKGAIHTPIAKIFLEKT